MIALEILLNGKRLGVAGADDLGVLHAIVTAGGQLGSKTVRVHRNPEANPDANMHPDFTLHVGGLTSRGDNAKNEHLRWHLPAQISVGDTIEIRLLDVPLETVDLPIVEANPTEASEHRRFLSVKAQ